MSPFGLKTEIVVVCIIPPKSALKKASKKPAKNSVAAPKQKEEPSLADAISAIAEELRPLYQIENLADHVASLISPLSALADAYALGIIARYGAEEDRRIALIKLKGYFEEFRD